MGQSGEGVTAVLLLRPVDVCDQTDLLCVVVKNKTC